MTRSPSDTAETSTQPNGSEPNPDRIEAALETLIALVEPLHALLRQETGLEAQSADRLKEVMTTLAAITAKLDRMTEALSQSSEDAPILTALESRLSDTDRRLAALEERSRRIENGLELLIDWAGAAPRKAAGSRD